ncbi:MAG TPA: GDSL-type esterase/lipase family protein [Polyangiaceae bacterium]
MVACSRSWSGLSAGLLLFAAFSACSTGDGVPPDETAGSAGTGGSSGAGASGGGGGTSGAGTAGSPAAGDGAGGEDDPGPRCDPEANRFGTVEAANPLVSVGKSVEASDGVSNPEAVVDGAYHEGSGAKFGTPTEDDPRWIAIDVGEGPARLLLTWADTAFTDYTHSATIPRDYRVETAADFSDADEDWETVASFEGNEVRTGGVSFDFEGKRWVRFVVTAAPGATPPVVIDEIALYDASDSPDERASDSWFFLGDSITSGAFPRNFGDSDFDAQVRAARPDFTPALVNAGISGETAAGALSRLPDVLEQSASFRFVAIGYGTNDSWGNQNVELVRFEDTLNEIVEQVLDSGATPILARIPFANGKNAAGQDEHRSVPDFNAVIDRISAERGLPCGPDFYAWFEAHPEELSADGVHPTSSGYRSMNRLWAEAALALYPAAD